MEASYETLVDQAKGGDKTALEILIQLVQNQIDNLAVRMLYDPADAEDAAEEILIRRLNPISMSKRRMCLWKIFAAS